MIDYNKNEWFASTRLMGSVLPRAVPQALVSLLLAWVIITVSTGRALDTPEAFFPAMYSPYVHNVSMISIGLVVAFRVNLAYNRFWEAATTVTSMRSRWWNAATAIVAFDDKWSGVRPHVASTAAARGHRAFRATVVHLFSLLHAAAVLEIKECWDETCFVDDAPVVEQTCVDTLSAIIPFVQALHGYRLKRVQRLRVEVLGGIDPSERVTFQSRRDHAWVELVSLRLHRVLAERVRAGGLDLPPPIVARIFSDISEGILQCTGAQKIAQVSFPYPFFELMRWIKWYFVATVPLAIVSFTTIHAVAYSFSFLSALFLVSLIEVAEELEDPFGEDANDLPLLDFHREFNEILHSIFNQQPFEVDIASSPTCMEFQAQLLESLNGRLSSRSNQLLNAPAPPARNNPPSIPAPAEAGPVELMSSSSRLTLGATAPGVRVETIQVLQVRH